MVIMKSDVSIFNDNFFGPYFKDKDPDCNLYSIEGTRIGIHKELLYPSKLMRNILKDANSFCCKKIEFFCPCSEVELEFFVDFLYSRTISFNEYININEFIDNISKTFGFPDKLFSVKYCSQNTNDTENYPIINEEVNSQIKEEFECLDEQNIKVFENETNFTKSNTSSSKLNGLENFETDPLSSNANGNDTAFRGKYLQKEIS